MRVSQRQPAREPPEALPSPSTGERGKAGEEADHERSTSTDEVSNALNEQVLSKTPPGGRFGKTASPARWTNPWIKCMPISTIYNTSHLRERQVWHLQPIAPVDELQG